MAKKPEKHDKLDLESWIQDTDFVAQTANGTAKWKGTGWNQQAYDLTMEQIEPVPTAPGGRSNRTGE